MTLLNQMIMFFFDDPLCKKNDETSNNFDKKFFRSVILYNQYHPSKSKFDTEKFWSLTRSSKMQSFNKFLWILCLCGNGTVHISPKFSLTNPNLPITILLEKHPNQLWYTSLTLKKHFVFLQHLLFLLNNHFHEVWIR